MNVYHQHQAFPNYFHQMPMLHRGGTVIKDHSWSEHWLEPQIIITRDLYTITEHPNEDGFDDCDDNDDDYSISSTSCMDKSTRTDDTIDSSSFGSHDGLNDLNDPNLDIPGFKRPKNPLVQLWHTLLNMPDCQDCQ